jgi:hypothetical protein
MTNDEAMAKAREMWGNRAACRIETLVDDSGNVYSTFDVGYKGSNLVGYPCTTWINGKTWEEAFANVEVYERKKAAEDLESQGAKAIQ